ncbi:hypothetical protein MIND_01116700 [Mycena indigotica]|uniref:Uncharacterized protein n=1 Tax=Mycena indigotica TaxID=2126181 RepID=A0A8H6S7W0_9AGAR|nr:uncharacterized protein MIND_01116700 [Mycena indigotica]KAF7293397.1 hypothetical protein MIND_01116700 [Mycena indigotica]
MAIHHPLDILPSELWDRVYDFLRGQLLLKLAGNWDVGLSLNALTMAKKIRLDSYAIAALPPCMIRKEFSVEVLRCENLNALDLSKLLACLDSIILRSPKLHSLSISFDADLCSLPPEARQLVLPPLCQTLSLFTHRNTKHNDPVFVFTHYAMFSCSSADLAQWDLHNGRFNAPRVK